MTEEQQINSLINVQDFLQKIEKIAEEKRIEYLDAVLYYCDQTGLEIETAAELIKKNAKFKARVRQDAESAGYFPKTAKLPI
jgi:hypothetical protein